MLYREIVTVCSQIRTKTHKYTVWAERKFCVMLNLVVHIVTTGFLRVNKAFCATAELPSEPPGHPAIRH